MRRSLALTGFVFVSLTVATSADDRPFLQRIAERTPYPHVNIDHSMARAGNPQSVRRHAIPSITRFDNAGYVGGASLRNNNLFARGPGSAVGPIQDGTFATDYTGLRGHLGRVFLAPSDDPSRGHSFYRGYSAEGPRVVDIFAKRPIRNAILEQREAAEERKHGHEGHGEGGHGGGEHGGGEHGGMGGGHE